MSKTKVIAFANNKGGSGKTTSVSNVGCAMARLGKKVLLIDADMQVNLTLSLFDEEKALGFARNGKNIYAAIKSESDLSDFAVHTDYDGLDIVHSTPEMSEIEYELFRKKEQRAILKGCLAATVERGYYDYVIIDAPPTLGAWVMNIMCASDFAVIPVEASPWGLFGLANMFDFIAKSTEHNSSLEVLGIAITKADERKNYFKETVKTLAESEIARLFETYIRVDSAVEWSQDNSKPVVAYKKYSRSALEYMKLTKEILKYADR